METFLRKMFPWVCGGEVLDKRERNGKSKWSLFLSLRKRKAVLYASIFTRLYIYNIFYVSEASEHYLYFYPII